MLFRRTHLLWGNSSQPQYEQSLATPEVLGLADAIRAYPFHITFSIYSDGKDNLGYRFDSYVDRHSLSGLRIFGGEICDSFFVIFKESI